MVRRKDRDKAVVVRGRSPRTFPEYVLSLDQDPLAAVQLAGERYEHGLYVGGLDDRFVTTDPRQWLLVLGPSQKGKTAGVFIPGVVMHNGAVVSTSTKPDVLGATFPARRRLGRCWVFDPSRTVELPAGAERLQWSPVQAAGSWDAAMAIADAMVESADPGKGVVDATHWTERASALLSALLYCASVSGRPMRDVMSWVLDEDDVKGTPDGLLAQVGEVERSDGRLAYLTWSSVWNTELRERRYIYSALAGVLKAYRASGVLDATDEPNFDAAGFVRGRDTLYIVGPAHLQALYAPLTVGLVDSIRQETYMAFHDGMLRWPVFFALDEAANIAPLPMLPAMASEGGGQGAVGAVGLQDLSQARIRWGAAAEGFLSLFPAKVVFRGIGDQKTLDALSTMSGEWDRPVRSVSVTRPGVKTGYWLRRDGDSQSVSWTTSREKVLSPAVISQGYPGHALFLSEGPPVWVRRTLWFESEPWRTAVGYSALDGVRPLPAIDGAS
jgi:type IV secretion system protein VirD4